MTWRRLAVVAVILLVGCVPFVPVGGKLTLSDQGFEVELPEGWYRHQFSNPKVSAAVMGVILAHGDWPGEGLAITKDGLPLQVIRIERVSIEEELSHTKRKFASVMPPYEVAEVELDNVRSNPDAFNFELLDNAPAVVGGRSGFRLVYTWKTKEGLRLKVVHYGFLEGDWVYRLVYQAAARHYFDRDVATFERILKSFRLLAIPA